jgi:hypothetical protein
MKSIAVRIDVAALQRLPLTARGQAAQELGKCTWTCGVTCTRTSPCGMTT